MSTSYRRAGSGRTTGGPEMVDEYLSPPSRSSMNLYDAVKQSDSATGTKLPPATRLPGSANEVKSSERQPEAKLPKKQKHNRNSQEVEFGTDDDVMPAKKTSRPTGSRPSPSYAARSPAASNTASLKQSNPSPSYAARAPASSNTASYDQSHSSRPPKKSGNGKKGRMVEEDELEFNDDGSSRRPGAFRVGGSSMAEEESMVTQLPNEYNTEVGQPHDDLIDADVVDPAEHERRLAERRAQEKKSAPLAGIMEERPWYKRPVIIGLGALLIIILIVVIAVVVSTSNKDSGPAYETESPTVSPAPTALALITMVLQLDNMPWETGWKIVCDNATVEEAPPGTYGLVTGRPNFRIEREFLVTVGDECELILSDKGGNGLQPGLFEIYNGDMSSIGDHSARITGGNIGKSEHAFPFTVGPSGESSPPGPSSPPTVTAAGNNPSLCTICPDGQPVLFPEAATVGSVTCEQLEALAMSITNETECKKIQDESAMQCGCRNHCTTICPDGVSGPNVSNYDSVVYVKNDHQVTCAEYQDQVSSSFSNSEDECLSANFLGEDVCGCPPTEAFCRICDNGVGNPTTNPPAKDLEKEIVPGVSCRDITGIAYTLKKDDPSGIFQELCPACLAIGAYCGCGQPPDGRTFCRLCGDTNTLLPEPARLVNSTVLKQTTTCYHVEFASNINSENTFPCDVYKKDSTLDCCF